MGQVMLESCQMQCQKINGDNKIKNKSEIYFNNMGSQLPKFTHRQSQNLLQSKASVVRNNQFLHELKILPSYYVQFVNHLFVQKKKFQDKIFPASANSYIWGGNQADNDWARLSDMSQQIAKIYKGISSLGKTKIIKVLEVMEENFSGCLQEITPIYIKKVSLAVCYLYINGNKQQVVVDDLIPTSHLKYFTEANKWHFLVQKAFAKLIGSYALVQEFTLPELFQQITGFPFQISKKGQEWLNRDSSVKINQIQINSFRQVIQNEKVYYLQSGNQNFEVYSVKIIRGHSIKSLPFHNQPHLISLYKITCQKTQKISLRISFLNQKFENISNQPFASAQLALYKQFGDSFNITEKDIYTLGNNIYLGCPFFQLQAGQYYLFAKRDHLNIKATLVCYVGDNFKIKQIHSKQICKQILGKLKRTQRI